MTEVRGGTSHNVTPKDCKITFDIRIPVDRNCKSVEQDIETVRSGRWRKNGSVRAMYSILDETEPFEAPHDSPLVRALIIGGRGERECTRPMLIRKTGTGDMNILGSRWGIPVVTYGPGNPHEAHTINEKGVSQRIPEGH